MAVIRFKNNPKNIEMARQIRHQNEEMNSAITVEFSADNQFLHIEGPTIYLPLNIDPSSLCIEEGELMEHRSQPCVTDATRPKTVNVHLDSELVREINAIREFIRMNRQTAEETGVKDPTQHEVLLEVLRRGIEQMRKDYSGD